MRIVRCFITLSLSVVGLCILYPGFAGADNIVLPSFQSVGNAEDMMAVSMECKATHPYKPPFSLVDCTFVRMELTSPSELDTIKERSRWTNLVEKIDEKTADEIRSDFGDACKNGSRRKVKGEGVKFLNASMEKWGNDLVDDFCVCSKKTNVEDLQKCALELGERLSKEKACTVSVSTYTASLKRVSAEKWVGTTESGCVVNTHTVKYNNNDRWTYEVLRRKKPDADEFCQSALDKVTDNRTFKYESKVQPTARVDCSSLSMKGY